MGFNWAFKGLNSLTTRRCITAGGKTRA